MLAMFRLLLGYLKKSFHSIFFGFVFPIIMLTILVAVLGGDNAANTVLPGLVMSASPVLGIVTLAMTYSDFKQSIIIKRIGATPLRPWEFISSILIFHVILIFIGSFWTLGIGAALYHNQINWGAINWGYVLLSILLSSVMCSAVGVMVGILAPDFKVANAFSLLLYLPTSFLSGQYIPYQGISKQPALVIIAKIIPFSYPVSIMNRGWNNYSSSSDLANSALFNNYWVPILVSIVWIGALVFGAIMAYKYRRK
ncbi:ABC transporter permease [Spiroplasma sp. AdecLV25b]|uniref:ABC transporter permease n=1 Tax=Spiroplasma sp. AdecLV25b TaxID=3027162 RepID=UPI0027DEFF51|nr:ABC transporter permease [Spiroplasma sp. AdecLV25b]